MLLHEFACRCAEWALSLVNAQDPRSIEAIRVKRRWMAGEATDDELRVARVAAREASSEVTAQSAGDGANRAAARAAPRSAARDAAWSAEMTAAEVGETATYEHEIEILRNLINE